MYNDIFTIYKMNINGYKLDQELGSGTFGVTYSAYDIEGNKVAIKTVQIRSDKDKSMIEEEIDALKDMSKNDCFIYVVCYIDYFFAMLGNIPTAFIVTEYVDGERLYDFIKENPNGNIVPSYLWPIMFQLLMGLKYIHDKGYAHRDIKPENILITLDYTIKYIDFGLACIEKCQHINCTNLCKAEHGTLLFDPPEIFNRTIEESLEGAQARDMWALAILFFELCNGCSQFPFDIYSDEYERELTLDEIKANIASAPKYYSNYIGDDGRTDSFVNSLLINNWIFRPTINEAIDDFIYNILARVF